MYTFQDAIDLLQSAVVDAKSVADDATLADYVASASMVIWWERAIRFLQEAKDTHDNA